MADAVYFDASERFECLHEVHREEARVLHEQSASWFAEGHEEYGRATYAQAQRALREAEEAERAHLRSKKERAFEELHWHGECCVGVALSHEPCRFCLLPYRLGPLLSCAKKMPCWG